MYKFFTVLNVTICIIVIALIVQVFGYHMEDGNLRDVNIDYSSGWKYSDGSDADLMAPDRSEGVHVIERLVEPEETDGASLCFMTRNLFFTVSLGGDIIYDFHPELTGIMGDYYGDYIHYVSLPSYSGTQKLSVSYVSLLDATGTVFQDMRLQISQRYEQDLIASNYYKFFISSVIVVIGILIVMFGFFMDTDERHRMETTSLGAFSVILGVWTNSGTLIIQTITNDSVYTRLMDYTALMLMPVPVMIFSASYFGAADSKLFKFSVILPIVNFIFTFGAALFGITDYHDILFLTHLVILICMVTLIVLFFVYRKKGRESGEYKGFPPMITAAFIIQIGSGLIDMIRYYFGRSMDTAQFSRVGLTIFVVILAFYELKQIFYINQRETELRLMEKLAHTDGLTKLGNRNAFERLENDLKSRPDGKCVFIQFDINDLKLVNDKYGHAEGDKHIITAAEIIGKSFPGSDCFRMGGDEFLTVITGNSCEKDAADGIDAMTAMQENYNSSQKPAVPLAIAYGLAACDLSSGDPEKAERDADMKMYECKQRLKGGKSYR